MFRLALCLSLVLVLAPPARAQETAAEAATLVADQVRIEADSRLIAEGAVEVLHKGVRLKASKVTYDQTADRLLIEGPIVLEDGTGTRVLADQADLSADLTEGLLIGARLVLNQQLQMASTQMMRVGGRYTELGRSVASSCQVCADNPTPLWEIRASRVVHDQQERQIYFEDAQLRVMGLPVAYVPRLRMPDPTLERANGFLMPRIRSTNQLGTGVLVPYFLTLGDSRDLTITPYISSNDAQTLDLRYRQAFATGGIEFSGAISQDQIVPGATRGYLFGSGSFALPDDFQLSFGLQMASDNSYLLDYGISAQDRLDSFLQVERVRRTEYVYMGGTHLQSLRDGDDNATLPSSVVTQVYDRRFSPQFFGGLAEVHYEALARGRSSNDTTDSDGDGTSDGQDLARGIVQLDWRRDWVLPAGIVGAVEARLLADVTSIQQDPAYPNTIERAYGVIGGEFRWPLVKSEQGGATQMIEPVVQLLFAPDSLPEVPDQDSIVVELDEGNLFSLDRFPGTDELELGTRAATGLTWSRYGTDGSTLQLAFGRVYHAEDLYQFTPSSGLDGTVSDWLVALQVAGWNGLTLTQRTLLDDDLSTPMAEMRLAWAGDKVGLTSGYYWGIADDEADRPNDVSELTFDGSWQMAANWNSRVSVRHDFIAGRNSTAGVGLQYRNECVLVDLSLSRWYADSTSVDPTTEFGLEVELLGFGAGSTPGPARQCRG
jgi:LPS-assembly protein